MNRSGNPRKSSAAGPLASPAVLLAGLLFSLSAHSATVYVRSPSGVTTTNPSLASNFGILPSGVSFNAEADLQQGTYKSLSIAAAPGGSAGLFAFTYAGISSLLVTNPTANPIALPAEYFSAHVEGIFGFQPGGSGLSDANGQVNALFSVAVNCVQGDPGCVPSVAGVSFNTGATYNGGTQTTTAIGTPFLTQENGATVNVLQANSIVLEADLLMPVTTLLPGNFLSINFDLLALASATNGAFAQANFLNTATLSMVLPQGVSLTSDAAVPLNWISNVPAPGALWLLGTGILGIFGLKWAKRSAG